MLRSKQLPSSLKRKTGIEPATPPLCRLLAPKAWKADASQTFCNARLLARSFPASNYLAYSLAKAEDGDRTRYPQLGRLMLYQVSYFRYGGRWI